MTSSRNNNEHQILRVKVKPNARQNLFRQAGDGSWLASVKAAPVDGQANKVLTALIAEYFNVRKASVTIKSGISSPYKTVLIASNT